ncbi:unnamed protein product [Linum tenue]|uniref:Uncharacterized protein n=1 Tax=Linum tenue TaxID=586396 RepID=A0AAV0LAQ9_9ROSI|nr:unnamed protein product [Linum tenue]
MLLTRFHRRSGSEGGFITWSSSGRKRSHMAFGSCRRRKNPDLERTRSEERKVAACNFESYQRQRRHPAMGFIWAISWHHKDVGDVNLMSSYTVLNLDGTTKLLGSLPMITTSLSSDSKEVKLQETLVREKVA